MKCKICGRKADYEFCSLHDKAYKNMQRRFEDWKKAMDISWREYLQDLERNSYAGSWVRDVASYLLSLDTTTEEPCEKGDDLSKT